MKTVQTVHVLNIDKDISTIPETELINEHRINKESFIVSDADEEILILISFKNAIDLKSIKIFSFTQCIAHKHVSAPKRVHIYKINNLNIDFGNLSCIKADKSTTCNAKKIKRGQIIHLQKSPKNAVKFKQTKYLAIYVESNQNDTESTVINAITFKSSPAIKATSSFNKSIVSILGKQNNLNKAKKPLYSLPKCVSIRSGDKCDHVETVLKSLCFYQSLDIEHNELHRDEIVKQFSGKYKTFLDDYIHIMLNHNHEIQHIYNRITSMHNMNKCTLAKCISAVRHHRDRDKELNSMTLSKEVMFWRETMDACHCYVYHLYDFGLRINVQNIKSRHDDTPYFDSQFNAICKQMKAIKTNLRNLERFSFARYENNKFALHATDSVHIEDADALFMDGFYQYMQQHVSLTQIHGIHNKLEYEEYDSEALKMDMKTDEDSNVREWFDDRHYLHSISDVFHHYIEEIKLSQATFKIGYRFYYWAYYENKEPAMFIRPKYASLKEEIEHNNIYRLTREKLDTSIQKATQLLQATYTKTITAQRYWNRDMNEIHHYGIQKGTCLTLDNLLSVLLYTDWSNLSKAFSSTFRAITPFESLFSVKTRNREFANWSKLLRETIEYFGNFGDPSSKNVVLEQSWKHLEIESGPFYCGLSSVYMIPEFNIELNAPISTTKQLEVAQRFADDNGITIQLNNNGDRYSYALASWNCCWLSTFSGEDERLWMGGIRRIRVETVLIMETSLNYQRYIQSLYYFDCMMTDVAIAVREDIDGPTDTDYLILSQLAKYKQKADKFPKYIQKTLESYTRNKKVIDINLGALDYCFAKLNDLIVYPLIKKESRETNQRCIELNGRKIVNLLKPTVFKLFDNLSTINIDTTQPYNYGIAEYEIDLLSLLCVLNKSNVSEVTIRAQHQYRISKADKYGNVQQRQHCGASWLSFVWKKYSKLLKAQYAVKGFAITLTFAVPMDVYSGPLGDFLYISRYS